MRSSAESKSSFRGCTGAITSSRTSAIAPKPPRPPNCTRTGRPYYVLDGEVTIRYGDKLEGGKEGADGEVRGGEIVGNVVPEKLVAGDVASAPAGVPHFWEVEPGKSVTYLTVKLGKKQ